MKIKNRREHILRRAIAIHKEEVISGLLNYLPDQPITNTTENRYLMQKSIEKYLRTLYKPEIKINIIDNEELRQENKMSVEIEIPLSYFMVNK